MALAKCLWYGVLLNTRACRWRPRWRDGVSASGGGVYTITIVALKPRGHRRVQDRTQGSDRVVAPAGSTFEEVTDVVQGRGVGNVVDLQNMSVPVVRSGKGCSTDAFPSFILEDYHAIILFKKGEQVVPFVLPRDDFNLLREATSS